MINERAFTVREEDAGTRLDFFLARHLFCGQRAAKRLIADGGVNVDGKQRPPHFKLPAGTRVSLNETKTPPFSVPVRLVARNGDFAAFFKPGGLHTAAIRGSSAASLENSLAEQGISVTLLSRLDGETSGLVPAAFSQQAVDLFKTMEAEGRIRKEYLALVHGTPEGPLLLRNALDTDGRKMTRVLEHLTDDATRHTELIPLPLPSPKEGTSLVAVRIRRGARHQIRAHLAAAGFPILGDGLYGNGQTSEGVLFLHHARVTLPGFTAFVPPSWLPEFLEQLLEYGPCVSRN